VIAKLLPRRPGALVAAIIVAAVALPRLASAQQHPRTVPELRLDATSARVSRLELSAGALVPVGIYTRLALSAGAGMAGSGGEYHTVGRGDAIARFELDPLKQHSHGAYVGGGISLLGVSGPHVRAWLAIVAGIEFNAHAGWVPTVEAGLGGGARLGVSVHRAMELWR